MASKKKISLEISADTKLGGIKTAQNELTSLGKSADAAHAGFKKLESGVVIAAGGIAIIERALSFASGKFTAFQAVMSKGERLGNLSTITGETVSNLVLLQHALQVAGQDAGNVSMIFSRISKSLEDAENPTSTAARAFANLGVDVAEFQKLSPVAQIQAFQKAFASLPNSIAKAQAAMGLFGKSGAEMLPLLADSSAFERAKSKMGDFAAYQEKMAGTHTRISEELTTSSERMGAAWGMIYDKFIPAVEALAKALNSLPTGALASALSIGASATAFATVAGSRALYTGLRGGTANGIASASINSVSRNGISALPPTTKGQDIGRTPIKPSPQGRGNFISLGRIALPTTPQSIGYDSPIGPQGPLSRRASRSWMRTQYLSAVAINRRNGGTLSLGSSGRGIVGGGMGGIIGSEIGGLAGHAAGAMGAGGKTAGGLGALGSVAGGAAMGTAMGGPVGAIVGAGVCAVSSVASAYSDLTKTVSELQNVLSVGIAKQTNFSDLLGEQDVEKKVKSLEADLKTYENMVSTFNGFDKILGADKPAVKALADTRTALNNLLREREKIIEQNNKIKAQRATMLDTADTKAATAISAPLIQKYDEQRNAFLFSRAKTSEEKQQYHSNAVQKLAQENGFDSWTSEGLANEVNSEFESLKDKSQNGATGEEKLTAAKELEKLIKSGVIEKANALLTQSEQIEKQIGAETYKDKHTDIQIESQKLENAYTKGEIKFKEYAEKRKKILEDELQAESEIDDSPIAQKERALLRLQLEGQLSKKEKTDNITEFRASDSLAKIGGSIGGISESLTASFARRSATAGEKSLLYLQQITRNTSTPITATAA